MTTLGFSLNLVVYDRSEGSTIKVVMKTMMHCLTSVQLCPITLTFANFASILSSKTHRNYSFFELFIVSLLEVIS